MLGVLRDGVQVARSALAGGRGRSRAADRLVPCDLVELLRAFAGEAEPDDVALARGADVGRDVRQLQVAARRLGDRRVTLGVELEEVVDGCGGRRVGDARAPGRRLTAHHGHLRRYGQHREALRNLSSEPRRVEELRARVLRAGDESLRLRVEEIEGGGRALLRVDLHLAQQVVEAGKGDHAPGAVVGGPRDVGLEVVELQLGRLADDLRRLARVVDAGELDHDLVLALLPDLGLGDAELVDAAAHDRDRALHARRIAGLALRRHRLEHDLQSTLQVEAQGDLLVDRRARDRECEHADERQRDQADQDQL